MLGEDIAEAQAMIKSVDMNGDGQIDFDEVSGEGGNSSGWIESEQGFELSFDADRAQVLATVNRLGFGIPPSGSEYREGDVMGLNVGVSEDEGGSTLHCIPG